MKAVGIFTAVVLMMIGPVALGQEQKVVDRAQLVLREGLVYKGDSGELFTGMAIEIWPNGQEKAESEYRDGKKHGRSVNWYVNGQKMAESLWRDGQREGKAIVWYNNGQKREEGEYRNGIIISRKKWTPSGQPI